MTSVLLQPQCDGVDSINLSKLRDWSIISDAGYTWAAVYIGGDYGVQGYAIKAAWDAGILLMPNYERNGGAAKGGYQVGKLAATTAIQQLEALGFQGECPVIFSGCDEGFENWQLPAAMDYHRAIVDVFTAKGWVGGSYGLKKVMELLPQQPWWPADWPIWHWGGDGFVIYPWAWVKQWYGKKPAILGDPRDNSGIKFTVDENTQFIAMKFWSGYGADKIEPTPPPTQQGALAMGQHISWVDVIQEATQTEPEVWIYFGEIVMRNDGVLARTDSSNDAVGVFGLPRIRSYKLAYEALPVWDPVADAQWLGAHLGIVGGQPINGVRITSVPGNAVAY
jgi:hypothetical protein